MADKMMGDSTIHLSSICFAALIAACLATQVTINTTTVKHITEKHYLSFSIALFFQDEDRWKKFDIR